MLFKALLKKQMKEMFELITANKRTNKKGKASNSSAGYKALMIILWLFVLLSLAVAFVGVGFALGKVLFEADAQWLYFSLTGFIALFIGVFGSVFTIYASVYTAKDNDVLLSMPIPPAYIICVRLVSSFIVALLCEIATLAPLMFVYSIYNEVSLLMVLSWIVMVLLMSLVSIGLSCLLGFVVAAISKHLKNKSVISVILTLGFLTGYYVVYFNIQKLLNGILENAFIIGDTIKKRIFPVYAFGKACAGDALYFAVFAVIALAFFGLVYLFMSKSFISLTTGGKTEKKEKYVAKNEVQESIQKTFLKREFAHLLSSSAYMINAGLGSVMMPVAAVALVLGRNKILPVLNMLEIVTPGLSGMLPLYGVIIVMFFASTCCFTAPAISLEGNTYWLLRSLPVDMKDVLDAKVKMHMLLTAIPSLILAVTFALVIPMSIAAKLLVVLVCYAMVLFTAYLGLFLNIKMPKFDWVNEAAVVKQSGSVMITLFAGWGIALVLYILAGVLFKTFSLVVILAAFLVLFMAFAYILKRWIYTKGIDVLNTL